MKIKNLLINSDNNIFKNYVKIYEDYKTNYKAYDDDFYEPFIVDNKNKKESIDKKFFIPLPLKNTFTPFNDIKIYDWNKLNRFIIKLKDKNKLRLRNINLKYD